MVLSMKQKTPAYVCATLAIVSFISGVYLALKDIQSYRGAFAIGIMLSVITWHESKFKLKRRKKNGV